MARKASISTTVSAAEGLTADEMMNRRVFCGVFPTGISWADRTREEFSDYKKLAFLPFSTLVLEFQPDCPPDILAWIAKSARYYQDRRGEQFRVSQCGQTVTLGK